MKSAICKIRNCLLPRNWPYLAAFTVAVCIQNLCSGVGMTLAEGRANAGSTSMPFESARPNYPWTFPRDHGAHPKFETEWWYVTGQLARAGRDIFTDAELGFQLTFFRRASSSGQGNWNQTYLAHAAVSLFAPSSSPLVTVSTEPRFLFNSLLARAGLGIAGADERTLHVWNHGYELQRVGDSLVLTFSLPHEGKELELALVASDVDFPLLQGDKGYSAKGTCSGCASQYYSIPRMKLSGEMRYNNQVIDVAGLGWLDHEFMSQALASDFVGWDWFSLMGRDGTDIMLFKLRASKSDEDFFSGTLRKNGVVTTLTGTDFSIEELSFWQSPATKARYPSGWRIEIPQFGIREEIHPRLAEQEIVPHQISGENSPAVTYWEGAVRSKNSNYIGYVELTGYDKPIGKLF